jgi:hypothetical protein
MHTLHWAANCQTMKQARIDVLTFLCSKENNVHLKNHAYLKSLGDFFGKSFHRLNINCYYIYFSLLKRSFHIVPTTQNSAPTSPLLCSCFCETFYKTNTKVNVCILTYMNIWTQSYVYEIMRTFRRLMPYHQFLGLNMA